MVDMPAHAHQSEAGDRRNPLRGVLVGISSPMTSSICLDDFLKTQYLIII